MKHLIKDMELVACLEGQLTKEEVKRLKEKLSENGELSLLYHLQCVYDNGLEEYANELIGEDDFSTKDSSTICLKPFTSSNEYRMVADKVFPEKEE